MLLIYVQLAIVAVNPLLVHLSLHFLGLVQAPYFTVLLVDLRLLAVVQLVPPIVKLDLIVFLVDPIGLVLQLLLHQQVVDLLTSVLLLLPQI